MDVLPVLLGTGRRLFDDDEQRDCDLERIGVDEHGSRTSMRFRVRRDQVDG